MKLGLSFKKQTVGMFENKIYAKKNIGTETVTAIE
jgi:hypothetical protein